MKNTGNAESTADDAQAENYRAEKNFFRGEKIEKPEEKINCKTGNNRRCKA